MRKTEHYQQHLDRVSRSFAFCIARLDGEMREWVGLAYLLCRILDTVEDAAWPDPATRERAFAAFEQFLARGADPGEVSAWVALFPAVPAGELLLLRDSARLFSDLHALPAAVREKIRRPVLNMYRGMRHFGAGRHPGAALRLESLADVNQYCFFVAGLVGGLLTELLGERCPSFADSGKLHLDAHHFGLFLQKVNLLKDQAVDEREGRFLVPSRRELLASLKANAEGAIRYLQALPVAERGFRLFCAWSLFLGLASLPWVERSWSLGVLAKIPRMITQALLGSVERIIDDNQALQALFQQMLPSLPAPSPAAIACRDVPWLRVAYEGRLAEAEFRELGMLPAG